MACPLLTRADFLFLWGQTVPFLPWGAALNAPWIRQCGNGCILDVRQLSVNCESGAHATPKKICPRQTKTSQTEGSLRPRRAISHFIGPYLTPERAQCRMKRTTLSLGLGGPIPSLRGGPFPDMKRLIRELRGPQIGKDKRSKPYEKVTIEARCIPEGPTFCLG